jgi:hypothetical protein
LISKKPVPTKAQTESQERVSCKECGGWHHQKVQHLDYIGHAVLTDRLLDADPFWNWEPVTFGEDGLPKFDQTGGLWIKLTVQGVTRLGYGHAQPSNFKEIGSREKEVIGDALRNAAMRFGAALDLWSKVDLHFDEKEEVPVKSLPDYPQDQFEANMSKWDLSIRAGKLTHEKLIAMISTKGVLSPQQTKRILELGREPGSDDGDQSCK